MKLSKEFFIGLLEKAEPFIKKNRMIILALFAGVLLLTFTLPGKDGELQTLLPEEDIYTSSASEGFNLTEFEEQLRQTISQIEGVGRVSLSLSLSATEEAVYAADIRQSTQTAGSSSYESSISIVSDGSYGQQPVVVKSLYPTFRGALVLCDGADNSVVRLAVTEAVRTMCGIGSDKVSVLKMQS